MKRALIAPMASVALLVGLSACGDDDEVTVPETIDVPDVSVPDSIAVPDATLPDVGDTTTIPADAPVEDRLDAASEALASGDFALLLDALQLSGVAEDIGDRAVTLLAPNDEAFRALSEDDLTSLLADPTMLDDVLGRHVLEGVFTYEELQGLDSVDTITGETLEVTTEGDTVMIGGAAVTQLDTEEDVEEIAVFQIDEVLFDDAMAG